MAEVPYIKQLQRNIEGLQDGFDIKSVELALMESEMKEQARPNELLGQLSGYHLEMLSELIDHCKDKKVTERILASKDRLIKLLDIGHDLNILSVHNQSLKLLNREIVAKIQLLRIENSQLKTALKKITDAEQF